MTNDNREKGGISQRHAVTVEHQELVTEACRERSRVVEVAPETSLLVKDFDCAIDRPIAWFTRASLRPQEHADSLPDIRKARGVTITVDVRHHPRAGGTTNTKLQPFGRSVGHQAGQHAQEVLEDAQRSGRGDANVLRIDHIGAVLLACIRGSEPQEMSEGH